MLPGPPEDSRPLPRVGHSLVSCGPSSDRGDDDDHDDGLLYLFGGLTRQHELMTGLWQYNVTSRRWLLMDSSSTYHPAPRSQSLNNSYNNVILMILLQCVSIACYAKRCTSYRKSVCLSV